MIRESIKDLVEGRNLSREDARAVMQEIMTGQATNAQIAAFLTALRMKGETVEELVSFAQVMRENCNRINPNVHGRLVDTCGTGGAQLKTFNVSTAVAFVMAGAGVPIAKHGNRAVSSNSGSADVLELLGVNLGLEPDGVKAAIEQVGIGFMFAPAFHPAMKYAITPRKEMGIRTVFNMLGPLTNPACANAQLLGVYSAEVTEPLALSLKGLDCEEAMVVHGLDGLDEVSTVGKTVVSHLKDGEVKTFTVKPEDMGLKQAEISDLLGSTVEENAETLFKILNGQALGKPKTDIALANSAAGLTVGGKTSDFKEGVELARESIESGSAYKKLKSLVKASGGDASKLEELEQHV
ncbi:MAG: anthranilate phosphoribosyltransferase [Candidatus Bathyarchaeota archaeon]|nr:anthranilate phosphoribosyltransferase [Candidatus Bathyarchaeota archaeon]